MVSPGSEKVFLGSGIWPKFSACFGKMQNILTGKGIRLLSGKCDPPKSGNGKRDYLNVCWEILGSSTKCESTRWAFSGVSYQSKLYSVNKNWPTIPDKTTWERFPHHVHFPTQQNYCQNDAFAERKPLPPIQCCFPQTPRDQAFFWIHINIEGRTGTATMFRKMLSKYTIFSTVLSKIAGCPVIITNRQAD